MRFQLPIPIILIATVFLYRAPSLSASGITDVDYYWHLAYGEWILDHLQLPTVDFWSWTFQGHPYRLTQWLGEVLMALAQRLAGGELGTQILSATLVSLTIAFSYQAARTFLPNRLAAIALALAGDTVLISLACRPHQFTHLGLAILTAILANYQVHASRRVLLYLPVLFALWVNLHGGYAVGLAYLWLVTGLSAVDAYVRHDPLELRQSVLPLAVAAAMSTLATLMNPYGIGAWQYAIEIAGLKSSSAGIVDEWGPTNIKMDVGLMWFMTSSLVFGAMASSHRRPSLRALLLALGVVAIGWSALRLSLMMTVLLVPLAAEAFRKTPLYTLAFDGPAARYDKAVRSSVWIPLLAVICLSSIAFARFDQTALKHVRETLPEGEVQFIKAHGIAGRLLNNPEVGGYLIRNLGQPVFLDTRLDLYGDQALFEFLFARRGDPIWRPFLTRHDPDVLLIDNLGALRELATGSGNYRLVFEGPRFSILVRHTDYPELPTIQPAVSRQVYLDLLRP